jgi:hypothetical protein
MSPAAKIPGALVSSHSFTTTPRLVLRSARSASSVHGRTPMPTTTRSAGSVAPPFELDVSPLDCARGLTQMEHDSVLLVDCADEVAVFAAEHAAGGLRGRIDGQLLNEKVMTTCADQGRRPAESGLDFP